MKIGAICRLCTSGEKLRTELTTRVAATMAIATATTIAVGIGGVGATETTTTYRGIAKLMYASDIYLNSFTVITGRDNASISFNAQRNEAGQYSSYGCARESSGEALEMPNSANRGSILVSFGANECSDEQARQIFVRCESDGTADWRSEGKGTVSSFGSSSQMLGGSIRSDAQCELLDNGVWYTLPGILSFEHAKIMQKEK